MSLGGASLWAPRPRRPAQAQRRLAPSFVPVLPTPAGENECWGPELLACVARSPAGLGSKSSHFQLVLGASGAAPRASLLPSLTMKSGSLLSQPLEANLTSTIKVNEMQGPLRLLLQLFTRWLPLVEGIHLSCQGLAFVPLIFMGPLTRSEAVC